MIISFFLYILSLLIGVIMTFMVSVSNLLSALPYITEATNWILGSLSYFGGIIDLVQLYTAISVLISFYVVMYTIKYFFWFLRLIPFFRDVQNPFAREDHINESIDRRFFSTHRSKTWTVDPKTGKTVSLRHGYGMRQK